MGWIKGRTLGVKEKEFKWKYSINEGLTIARAFKSGDSQTRFSDSDIDKIITYIKENERVLLANNVEKLSNETEKDGLGSFVYKNISYDVVDAQAVSQLVSIFHNLGILGYNGAKRGMEFWIIDDNWRGKITS